MKKTTFSSTLLAIALITSCKEDAKTPPQDIIYGPEVSVGPGKARSFVKLNAAGAPLALS